MDKVDIFVIPDGAVVNADYNKPATTYRKICIENNFYITDYDFSEHFGRHTELKDFVVLDKNSSFFTVQGCLYKKYLPTEFEGSGDSNIYDICGEIPKNIKNGCILICCPQANPIKDIILPEDCISIAGSAFYGCTLNSLTLPDSLITSAVAAFAGLKVDTIYVPNRYGNYAPDHNDVNLDVRVTCNDPFLPELKFETELFWRCIMNETMWDKNRDFIDLLFPDDGRDLELCDL